MTRHNHHNRPGAYIDIHVDPDNRAAPIFGNPTRLPAALYTLWRPGPEQAGNLVIHTGAPMLLGRGANGDIIATVACIRPRCARGRHGVTGWALVTEQSSVGVRVLVFRRRAQALRWARALLTPLRWEDDGPVEWSNIGTVIRRPHILLLAEREAWVRRNPSAYTGPSGAIHFLTDEDCAT
jgi:hypothetical protein